MDADTEVSFGTAVILRMMAAIVKRAGGELVVTEQDLVDTTFDRHAVEMRPGRSARLHLRPDREPRGTRQ